MKALACCSPEAEAVAAFQPGRGGDARRLTTRFTGLAVEVSDAKMACLA
jgi:hypothetical protein